MKKIKLVQQLSELGCGLAAIAMIFNYYDCKVDIPELNKITQVSRDGMSLKNLMKLANIYNFDAKAIKLLNYKHISSEEIILPCIAVQSDNHYVVISRVKKNLVEYFDPEKGFLKVSLENFFNNFTGILLMITPTDETIIKKRNSSKIKFLKINILSKFKIIEIISLGLLVQFFSLFSPFITQIIVDNIVNERNLNIFRITVLSCIILFSYGIVFFFRRHVILLLEKRYIKILKNNLIEKVFKIRISFFDVRAIGDIVSRINNIDELQKIISSLFAGVSIDIITIVLLSVFMINISPTIFIWICGYTVLLVVILICFLNIINIANKNVVISKESTHRYLYELLNSVTLMKIMNYSDKIMEKWRKIHDTQLYTEYRRENILNIYQSILLVYRLLPTIIILVYSSLLVHNKVITVGQMMQFIGLTNLFLTPFISSTQYIFEYQYAANNIDRINELVQEAEEDANGHMEIDDIETINFEDIYFGYSTNYDVLKNINIKINKGENISFVGQTGCGKSTIIKLMLLLYDNYSGNILVNNKNVLEYNLFKYRGLYGVVAQNNLFFNDTIKNNIDISSIYSDEEIYEILDMVCLKEDVLEMSGKIYTHIGDNGKNLSGGQQQRLSIARALINRPKILILDEGTNQLDSLTERKIMENLKDKNITVINITHRLSTLEFSDYIYFIDKGKIVDSGTHKQLLSNNYYKQVFDIC